MARGRGADMNVGDNILNLPPLLCVIPETAVAGCKGISRPQPLLFVILAPAGIFSGQGKGDLFYGINRVHW